MDQVQGKHFSITDPQNVNTVIYQINKTEGLMEENTPKFTLERLKCREELVGINKRKTFFVDAPKDEGNQLIILSFGQDRVVVNMGLLNKDEVKISKRPVPVKFNTLYSEQETEYKDVRYTPNFQRPITIIDPETTEEVKPVVYFDKDTNEVRGKCKLKPYKSYFAFEVREDKDTNGPTNGGSKFKVVGGTVIADEKEKTYKIPPEESMSISLPENENDYITIPLVPNKEIEHEM